MTAAVPPRIRQVFRLATGNNGVGEGSMKHLPIVLTAGFALALSATGQAAGASKKAPTKAKNQGMVTCPTMKHLFEKAEVSRCRRRAARRSTSAASSASPRPSSSNNASFANKNLPG